jgi:hypothetical protein
MQVQKDKDTTSNFIGKSIGNEPPIKSTSSQTNPRSNSTLKPIVIILVLAIILGIWGYASLEESKNQTNTSETKASSEESTVVKNKPQAFKPTNNVKPHPFDSEKKTEETKAPDIKTPEHNKDMDLLIAQVGAYRHYLYNFNIVIYKFLQDQPYSEEINNILYPGFPTEINIILEDLHNYNSGYLDRPKDDKEVILPRQFRLIEKFVTIEKKEELYKEKDDLKAKIINNLPGLIEYFYSIELQTKFVDEKLEK